MIDDIYQGYFDAGYGSDYFSRENDTLNEDYNLGVELSNCAYFLTTSDSSYEYDSDKKKYNAVRDKINNSYDGLIATSDELFYAPVWSLRVFNSPELRIVRNTNFIHDFTTVESLDFKYEDDWGTGIFTNHPQRLKSYYVKLALTPLSERLEVLEQMEGVIKWIDRQMPELLNPRLMESLAELEIDDPKLFKLETIFNMKHIPYAFKFLPIRSTR